MRRRLFTVLSALSQLLCVAVVVLWVRSYRLSDDLHYSGTTLHEHPRRADWEYTGVESCVGTLVFRHIRWSRSLDDVADPHRGSVDRLPSESPKVRWSVTEADELRYRTELLFWHRRMGFGVGSRPVGFEVPHWFVACLLAAPAALALQRAMRARSRRSLGRCPACGYDLRATPQRCPECGAVPRGCESAAKGGVISAG